MLPQRRASPACRRCAASAPCGRRDHLVALTRRAPPASCSRRAARARVDLSFTPVLDLTTAAAARSATAPSIAIRRVVAVPAQALCAGMAEGIAAWPALPATARRGRPATRRAGGRARLSTRLQRVTSPPPPSSGQPAGVMPAHVVPPQRRPAPNRSPQASRRSGWRRCARPPGFQGVIFSDDLNMEGARVAGDTSVSAKRPRGGCDMPLV